MGTTIRRAVRSIFFLTLLANLAPRTSAQDLPPPTTNRFLDSWSFLDTNWHSDLNFAPLGFTNLVLTTNMGGGLLLDTTNASPAYVAYHVVEYGGVTNLLLPIGTISLWFSPNWSGTNAGGTGPGAWGRLFEAGTYTTNASIGWFSLYLSPDGSMIYFAGQTNNGYGSTYLSAPISLTNNTWNNLVVTYGPTNSRLYWNGLPLTNGSGVSWYPGTAALTNGFSFGSSASDGLSQARGIFGYSATYTYQWDSNVVFLMYDMYRAWSYSGTTNEEDLSSAPSSPAAGPVFNVVTGPGYLTAISTNTTNCVTSTNIWITNVVATLAGNGTVTATFAIAGGSDGLFYDVFANSTLDVSSTAPWAWMGQGQHCVTYILTNLPSTACFLLLGQPTDGDNDGLTDAYERLVSKTDPSNPDSDYDGIGDGWEVLAGTNPGDAGSVNKVRLGLWRFDTLTWQGEQGQLPAANTGLTNALIAGMEADAVDLGGTPGSKFLAYREGETNALFNFNLRSGTFRFWFNSRWNSVTNGGAGPGGLAPLLSVGTWTSNASVGEWRLAIDSTGDKIMLDTQDNAGHTATVPWGTIPGGMMSNQWRQIAVIFSPTNAAIYVDGTLVTSNGGLTNIYPPRTVRTSGLFIGNDSAGSNFCQGAFDLLDTYNYPLDPSQISVYTNQTLALPPVLLTNISITSPVDVKWTASSNLYVLSQSTAAITEYDTNFSVLRSKTGIGSNPNGFDVDTNGNVYVAITGSNQVWRFKPSSNTFLVDTNFNGVGYIGKTNGTAGSGSNEFNAPFGVSLSRDGTSIYVSDSTNNRVQKFTTNGAFLLSIGGSGTNFGQLNAPKGIKLGQDLSLYVADTGNNRFARILGDGVYAMFGSNGTAAGKFQSPLSASADAIKIYVADTGNNRIQKLDWKTQAPILVISNQFGFNQPKSVYLASDPAQERIYIADTGNNRIVVVAIPEADPLQAWNLAKTNLVNGNTEAALAQFSGVTLDNYRSLFSALGSTNLTSDINAIGQLTPFEIGDEQARYYFSRTIGGTPFIFIVTFANENGIWKIRNF